MLGDDIFLREARRDVAAARKRGDRLSEACALFELASILSGRMRSDEARSILDELKPIGEELIGPAEQTVVDARDQGDQRMEADALFTLSDVLGYADRHEEARSVISQANRISRELAKLNRRERAEKARRTAAQAIAAARERGDRRAEAYALHELSSELSDPSGALLNYDYEEEAAHVTRQAIRVSCEQRARERVESATQAVSAARANGDRAAEALALLTLGQALVVLGRPEEAEPLFEQAERLTDDVMAATKVLTGLSTLITLGKALRDAGRDDAARRVTQHADRLNPAVSNHVSDVEADSLIQAGVLHGNLTVHSGPRRPAAALQVSVTTRQVTTATYDYDGGGGHADTEVHVFVEAFTPQAVILRQLRPVVVRRIDRFRQSNAMMMLPREFRVGLDLPRTAYSAGLDEQALDLDAAFASGTADFPFSVTASDPEYFMIVPEARRTAGLIEWRLELDWSCLGQHGTVTIDHRQRPFLYAC